MFLDDVPVNYATVLLAALVYYIIGIIWYAPFLFGHRWMKHHESEMPNEVTEERHFWHQAKSYVGEFILSLILAYVMALFMQISQAEEIAEGIAVALWLWLGLIATTHFSAVLWGRKTIKNYCIHAGFMLVGFIAMGAAILYFEP